MKKRSVAEVGARLARLVLIAVIALAAACIFPVVGKGATAGRGLAARAQAQVRVRGAAQKEAPVALRATGRRLVGIRWTNSITGIWTGLRRERC
jgi:hypothetical protein